VGWQTWLSQFLEHSNPWLTVALIGDQYQTRLAIAWAGG